MEQQPELNLEAIKQLKQDYVTVFEQTGESGKRVLADIAKRAFANKTTLAPNKIQFAANEGRRTLYLHIESMLKLDINAVEEKLKQFETQQEGS